jgi:hypothetical protein
MEAHLNGAQQGVGEGVMAKLLRKPFLSGENKEKSES